MKPAIDALSGIRLEKTHEDRHKQTEMVWTVG